MNVHVKALLLSASALGAAAIGSPALGQAAPSATSAPTDKAPTDDIVITARRVAENLQSVPLAVSAVSGATLQRQAIRELKDLSSTVPNLQVKPANSGGSSVLFTIRGQAQSSTGLLYVDPAVGVYVDGLNLPRNLGLRSGLVDIQRLEVLRGPQGTLYGRNTTGGAVSIVTQDPKPDFGGSLQASYGNYNTWNLLGVINAPLAEGIGLRLVGQHSEHDPYGHQVATGTGLNDEKSTYLRAKLKIDRGRFKLSATGDYFDYKSAGPIYHLVGLVPGNPNEARISARVCVPTAGLVGADPTRVGGACGAGATAGNYYGVTGGTAASIARLYLQGATSPVTAAGLDLASAYLQQFVRRGANAAQGINFYDSQATSSALYTGDPNYQKDASNSSGYSGVVNMEYELSDQLTARSIAGVRHFKSYEAYDFDSTPLPLFETRNQIPGDTFYSEEAQLLGNFNRLSFVLGAFYSYERGRDLVPSIALQAPGGTAYGLADDRVRNISKAGFVQANYKVTDALTVTGGFRYTQEIRKLNNRNRSINANGTEYCGVPVSLLNDSGAPVILADPRANLPAGTTEACGANFSKSFARASWLASVDYKFSRDILGYLKASRGFRGGGQQGRANVPNAPAAFNPFNPETVTEYEGGLKSELFDRVLRLNMAVFYDDYKDVQKSLTIVATGGAGAYSAFLNAAAARLWGVEGEATVRVNPNFSVDGNISYLNAKYKSFSDQILGDRTGEPWPAPKWTYMVNARYTKDVGPGTASANLQWAWTGSTDLQPSALNRAQNIQSGYGLLNATVGFRLDRQGWEVAAYVRNLLAKEYYVAGTALETVGLNTLVVGDPRTFGLILTKRFGSEK